MLHATPLRSPLSHISDNMSDEEDRETLVMNSVKDYDDAETCSTITAVQSDGGDACDPLACDWSVDVAAEGAAHDSPRALSHSQASQISFLRERPPATPRRAPAGHRAVLPVVPFGSTTARGSSALPVVAAHWEAVGHPPLAAAVELGAVYAGHPLRVTYVYEVRRRNIPAPLRAARFAMSRLQCEIRLHFSRTGDESDFAYEWNSFDVTDCSSSNGTYCAAVPLLPLHRYSIRTKDVDGSIQLRFGDTYRLTIRISHCSTKKSGMLTERIQPPKGIDVGTQWSAPMIRGAPSASTTTKANLRHNASAKGKKQQTRKKQLKKVTRSRSSCAPKASSSKKRQKISIVDDMETFVSSQCAQPCITVVTTGMRISSAQTAKLRRLNIIVNPEPSEFHRLTHLVIDGPLMRSIKLLSALPYAQHIVSRAWFNAALSASTNGVDPSAFFYTEQRTRDSIETMNDFSLNQLMQTSTEQRQSFLSGDVFWVHPNTAPQEPPGNDIHSVIIASGGAVTRQLSEATVVVMPQLEPSAVMWRRMKGLEECAENCRFIVPDNLYRCVLQQRRLTETTVEIPSRYSVGSLRRPSSDERDLELFLNEISPRRRVS